MTAPGAARTSGSAPGGVLSRLAARLRSDVVQPVAERAGAAVRADDDPVALAEQADRVDDETNRRAGELPVDAVVLARRVTDLAREVLHAPREGEMNIHGRVALNAVLRDYVPTSIARYRAAARAQGNAQDAAAQLVEQLTLVRASLRDTLAALRDDDAMALEAQGMFLRTKFTGSDLS